MTAQYEDTLSTVERRALAASPFDVIYPPEEKIPAIVVDNFPSLGRLAAARFLEWAGTHPEGVVSLPTGKTPQYFIHWVTHFLETWDRNKTRAQLDECGLDAAGKPDLAGLRFVQIDEFYPIRSSQKNSFCNYVKDFYLAGFGLDPDRAMLIDCEHIALGAGQDLDEVWPAGTVDLSLRHRKAHNNLERLQKETLAKIDQWCQEYEERIRGMGGIGFFLGGIGPDGHIGFNVRGADHHSTTRLTPTNYETQAAAAQDLGGIEISSRRLVITIGLGTITANPDCTAIIIAAGETKAPVVADAVQQPAHILYPAAALRSLPRARFYLTAGAARGLDRRRCHEIAAAEKPADEVVERSVIDLSAARGTPLLELNAEDFDADPLARLALDRRGSEPGKLAREIHAGLESRIAAGARTLTGTRFFHTEPHHDDIMLGYLPYVVRHVRDTSNAHYFACMTSGFTAVTNGYFRSLLISARRRLYSREFDALDAEGYFRPDNASGRQRDIWEYLDGVAAGNEDMTDDGTCRRTLRNLAAVYGETDRRSLEKKIAELVDYLDTAYPGQKDPPDIQKLKGMCREWEAECLWGYFGWSCDNVMHLRLGFYTGDIFTEDPTASRDVPPILAAMRTVRPDVVTVALDPEASGPDTHYKVLQAVGEAVRQYVAETGNTNIRIWGYRNVWYRFHPAEANIYIPVSLNMFSIMQSAFLNTFISQREASFPSHAHDGPFCELAQNIQAGQYQVLKTCLGREWFHNNDNAMIRATRGFVFIWEMDIAEFSQRCRALKKSTENR